VTQVVVNLPPGIYHFEMVAISGTIESPPSARITHAVKPGAPVKLRVVEIQTSSNLRDWETIAMIPQDPDKAPAEFVRARIASVLPAP